MIGITTILPITMAAIVLRDTKPAFDAFDCEVMDRLIPSKHMLIGIAAWPIYNMNKSIQDNSVSIRSRCERRRT